MACRKRRLGADPAAKATDTDAGGPLDDAGADFEQTLPEGCKLGPCERHPAGHGIAEGEQQPAGRGVLSGAWVARRSAR